MENSYAEGQTAKSIKLALCTTPWTLSTMCKNRLCQQDHRYEQQHSREAWQQ